MSGDGWDGFKGRGASRGAAVDALSSDGRDFLLGWLIHVVTPEQWDRAMAAAEDSCHGSGASQRA